MTDRIEKSLDLDAPIDRVWHALTDSEEFGEWFRVKIEGSFVPGEFSRGHITYPGYEHVIWEAKIERMEKPQVFSFSWHPYAVDPAVDYSNESPTLVEFHLAPTQFGTRLSIVESGFDAIPESRRDEAFRMNDGGWTEQMENIQQYLEPHDSNA